MENPIKTLHANMAKIQAAIGIEVIKGLKATNIKPVSERTLQMDIPARADGTNRIKLTVENGTFRIRGYRVEETDLIAGIAPDTLATALKNLGTI